MSKDHLIVINSGSSSIKFAVYQRDAELKKSLAGQVERINSSPILKIVDSAGALVQEKEFSRDHDYSYFYQLIIQAIESNKYHYKIRAVGHRVVHGGTKYQSGVIITDEIIHDLKELIPFAPLHQPYNIMAIESIQKAFPSLPQMASFDTAFHSTHPPVADRFGLPRELIEKGIRRYGFHGLSYEYINQQINKINPEKAKGRIIVAHLGNGSSMCAIHHGKSIESTMGFTALDGLVMGTRCGNLDPGVVLYLMQYKNMSVSEIESMLYKKSGLLGVSNITYDMRELLTSTSECAREAVDLFVYRIRRELGAMVSVLNGLDMLVFTGGIGEHAFQIREAVCSNHEWLGLQIDPVSNKKNDPIISSANSKIEVRVIPTNEEWIIAKETVRLMREDR